jgi:hypothetical protein
MLVASVVRGDPAASEVLAASADPVALVVLGASAALVVLGASAALDVPEALVASAALQPASAWARSPDPIGVERVHTPVPLPARRS